jgi:hypothetical protein
LLLLRDGRLAMVEDEEEEDMSMVIWQ